MKDEPSTTITKIISGGEDHQRIKREHHVIYEAKLRQDPNPNMIELKYCNVQPSAEKCRTCIYQDKCRFGSSFGKERS